MSEQTELESAIEEYRDGDAGCEEFEVLANAYIAHLDEHAALAVPYDWEWLAARPEFERDGDTLFFRTRESDCFIETIDPTYWRFACEERSFMIPAPATKGDVIKLLEVFS